MSSGSVPFWSLVDASGGPDACWPWLGTLDRDGYGIWGRKRSNRAAHELARNCVMRNRAVVRHTCDNRRCCNPGHLIGGTQGMNVADRVERGRSAVGTTNGRNVLNEVQVLAIYFGGGSLAQVAAMWGVSKWTVRDIKRGKIWGWLTAPYCHGNQTLRKPAEIPVRVDPVSATLSC